MAEVVGLALAAVALVGPILDAYNTCTTLVNDIRNRDADVHEVLRGLSIQRKIFKRNCSQLLMRLFDDQVVNEVLPILDESARKDYVKRKWDYTYGFYFDEHIEHVGAVLEVLEGELRRHIRKRSTSDKNREIARVASPDPEAARTSTVKNLVRDSGIFVAEKAHRLASKVHWITSGKTKAQALVDELRKRNEDLRHARELWENRTPKVESSRNQRAYAKSPYISRPTRHLAKEVYSKVFEASKKRGLCPKYEIQVGFAGAPGSNNELQIITAGKLGRKPVEENSETEVINAFLVKPAEKLGSVRSSGTSENNFMRSLTQNESHANGSNSSEEDCRCFLCHLSRLEVAQIDSSLAILDVADGFSLVPISPQVYAAGARLSDMFAIEEAQNKLFDRAARLSMAVNVALFPVYLGSYNPSWLKSSFQSSDVVVYFNCLQKLKDPTPYLRIRNLFSASRLFAAEQSLSSSYKTRNQLRSLAIILIELAFRKSLKELLKCFEIGREYGDLTDEDGAKIIVDQGKVLNEMGKSYNHAVKVCLYCNYADNDAGFERSNMRKWFMSSVYSSIKDCHESFTQGSRCIYHPQRPEPTGAPQLNGAISPLRDSESDLEAESETIAPTSSYSRSYSRSRDSNFYPPKPELELQMQHKADPVYLSYQNLQSERDYGF